MLERLRRATHTEAIKLNPYTEAVREHGNVLSLTGLAALSLATLNPVPLLVGAVAEAAYLVTIPDTTWYRKRVAGREDALNQQATRERRETLEREILPGLSRPANERYQRMVSLRTQIDRDAPQDTTLYNDIFHKLDQLLERFLTFAQTDQHFRTYLNSLATEIAQHGGAPPRASVSPPGGMGRIPRPRTAFSADNPPEPSRTGPPDGDAHWVERVVQTVTGAYANDQKGIDEQSAALAEDDDDTRTVLAKRHEVLQSRIDYVQKIGKILINLDQQMCLLEDTLGLINDQIRARPSNEVLTEVEDVVVQTSSMSAVLDELADHGKGL